MIPRRRREPPHVHRREASDLRGRRLPDPLPVRDRTARAWIRLHRRQLAPSHAALVDPRRRDLVGAHRRRAARVLDRAEGDRGRHRHHPEPEGARGALRARGADHRLPEGQGAGRGHRRRHRTAGGRRDPQPRSAHRHARQGREPRDGDDRRARRRLPHGRQEQEAARSDRRHPRRLDLLAGAQGQLRGREHAGRADDRPRPPHPRRRDRWLDLPARGRGIGGRHAARARHPVQRDGRGRERDGGSGRGRRGAGRLRRSRSRS